MVNLLVENTLVLTSHANLFVSVYIVVACVFAILGIMASFAAMNLFILLLCADGVAACSPAMALYVLALVALNTVIVRFAQEVAVVFVNTWHYTHVAQKIRTAHGPMWGSDEAWV